MKEEIGQSAKGGWYDDGNIHRIGMKRRGDQWEFTIDDIQQLTVPASGMKPCGIIVKRAAVAFYNISFSSDKNAQ